MAIPVSLPTGTTPFYYKGAATDRELAIDCLAVAAWQESGDDPEGQRSVIQVVLNRLRHPSFPKTVCGVVFQGSERTTGCQFSFTCDGSMQRRFPSVAQWNRARSAGKLALDGMVDRNVGQATHYHADYVTPWWSGALQRVNQIGAHIFYRWPGSQGRLVGIPGYKLGFANENDALAQSRWDGRRPTPATMHGMQPARLTAARVGADQGSGVPMAATPNTSRAHLFGVDPESPNGRWAVLALDQCKGSASCVAMGYAVGADLTGNSNVEAARMQRPLFLFVRDAGSGMDVALWDCGRAARAERSQCLPDDPAALAHLMRDR